MKLISGGYYVYETRNEKRADGSWRTVSGPCVGKIDPVRGFVANSGSLHDEEVSALDFGEWAVALANSRSTLAMLREFFSAHDAERIYAAALVHFVQGFTYMRDVASFYEMSTLSLRLPGLKLGYDALSRLYEDLGRRQGPVLAFEQALVERCSGQVAIDGHVMGCRSEESGLAEKGYKFGRLGEEQANLLMAYDVNTGMPLLSSLYEGGAADKVCVRDLLGQAEFCDLLFVVDRGFYSKENIELFTSNGCQYVIPLPKSSSACRLAVADMNLSGRFVYERGRKSAIVEFKEHRCDGRRVLVFRDANEAAAMQANYLRHLRRGDRGYTQEGFDASRELMAVTVLETSLADTPADEVYSIYKKRWAVETYFDYFKNGQDAHTLCLQDYHMAQGLAFVLLVSGIIHREVADALEASGLGMSMPEMLLEARKVKASKRHSIWVACNCKKKRLSLFEKMNTPLEVMPQA
ncbi:transposase [Adlercreutzia sp. ZJ138]|uniref:transposase n=1 Tax=Adlercreutzia sp. ZJ138 TaxID=2709405 RepID=UPI0013EC0DFB|nr:transposase [Adlercreutzia sp. ZJ138]